jgi:hypothetical protein
VPHFKFKVSNNVVQNERAIQPFKRFYFPIISISDFLKKVDEFGLSKKFIKPDLRLG